MPRTDGRLEGAGEGRLIYGDALVCKLKRKEVQRRRNVSVYLTRHARPPAGMPGHRLVVNCDQCLRTRRKPEWP